MGGMFPWQLGLCPGPAGAMGTTHDFCNQGQGMFDLLMTLTVAALALLFLKLVCFAFFF